MLFFVMLVIAVLIGFSLKELYVKKISILYSILVLQLGFRFLNFIIGHEIFNVILLIIQLISLTLLVIFIWYNIKQPGIITIGIGFLLNLIVMIFNKGKMPVLIDNINKFDIRHFQMNDNTKLGFLADIIDLPYPLNLGMVRASIGDLIIGVGLMMFIVQMIYMKNKV